jgi:hypothetical protein
MREQLHEVMTATASLESLREALADHEIKSEEIIAVLAVEASFTGNAMQTTQPRLRVIYRKAAA